MVTSLRNLVQIPKLVDPDVQVSLSCYTLVSFGKKLGLLFQSWAPETPLEIGMQAAVEFG